MVGCLNAAVSQIAPAQTSGTPHSTRICQIGEDGVRAPIVIQKRDPKYQGEACQAVRQGTAVLSLIVSSIGRAQEVNVARPLGFGLDQQAVQAIQIWRFKPAMKDGRAAPVYGTIEVHFRLPGKCYLVPKSAEIQSSPVPVVEQ